MPSCNEMEAHVGVALAYVESAKERLIDVFRRVHPHAFKVEELSHCEMQIHMAELELNSASMEAERLRVMVTAMIEAQGKSS